MMILEIRRTTPEELLEVAREVTGQILVCQFNSPLTVPHLTALACALSREGVNPDDLTIRAIRHEPAVTNSTALSLDALAMHTDGSFLAEPPRRFMLSCVKADEGGGGVSTLLPVGRIVEHAPDWVLKSLSTAEYRFLMTYDGDMAASFTGPVLSEGPDGVTRIRWRGDHIYRPVPVRDDDGSAGKAAEWLYEFLGSCEPCTYELRHGELMIVPNGYFVHGRRALSPGSGREIIRAWTF
jgi:hypothetical protein